MNSNKSNKDSPNQIYVTGYSRSKVRDERDLKDMFREFGTISNVVFKGHYAFITFQTQSEVEKAMEDMNGKTVDGIKMKIEIVDSRRARRTGPSDTDECFKCKQRGHWARDCTQKRSQSRSRRRRYSRQRSNSRSRDRRRRSFSQSSESRSQSSRRHDRRRKRSDSRKQRRNKKSHSRSKKNRKRSSSQSGSYSRSGSRSKSPAKKRSPSNA